MGEQNIKLETVWLALKRHFFLFFGIFGTMILCGSLASVFLVKKEYQSSIKLEVPNAVSYVHLNNLSDLCTDKRIYTLVLNSLSEKGITHSDGKAITESDLSSGLIAPKYRENGYSVTPLFQSTDEKITKPVLDELGAIVIEYASQFYDKFYSHFRVAGEASEPIKISQEKTTFYVFLIVGIVLGYGACFFKEVFDNRLPSEAKAITLGKDSSAVLWSEDDMKNE